jgi:hypothetical protein
VPTEFAQVAGLQEQLGPGILTWSAAQVAEDGYRGLMQGKRVVVPGFVNKLAILLMRFLPRRMLLAAVDRRQSRRRSAQST